MPPTVKHIIKRLKKWNMNWHWQFYIAANDEIHVSFIDRTLSIIILLEHKFIYRYADTYKVHDRRKDYLDNNRWQNNSIHFLRLAFGRPKIERYMNSKVRRLWILRLILIILK